jgi:hypothetical protein
MQGWKQAQLSVVRNAIGYGQAFSAAVLIVCYVQPVVAPARDPLKPSCSSTVNLANGKMGTRMIRL